MLLLLKLFNNKLILLLPVLLLVIFKFEFVSGLEQIPLTGLWSLLGKAILNFNLNNENF
jgi:hypothetical protein